MESLDAILELLSDQNCHDINEISTLEPIRKLSITKIMELLKFLAEYDFIELSEKMVEEEIVDLLILEAKLTRSTQEFMQKIQSIESEEELKSRQ